MLVFILSWLMHSSPHALALLTRSSPCTAPPLVTSHTHLSCCVPSVRAHFGQIPHVVNSYACLSPGCKVLAYPAQEGRVQAAIEGRGPRPLGATLMQLLAGAAFNGSVSDQVDAGDKNKEGDRDRRPYRCYYLHNINIVVTQSLIYDLQAKHATDSPLRFKSWYGSGADQHA